MNLPNSNLITDGLFVNGSTYWVTGIGVSIANGKVSFVNVGANLDSLYQVQFAYTKDFYKITYTISNYVAGGVYTCWGAAGIGTTRSANGTFTDIVDSGQAYVAFIFKASAAGTTLDISNVMVQYANLQTHLSDGYIYNTANQVTWSKIDDLTPLHHYKLNELSGTVANDSGSNPIIGSITSCVLNQTGKIDKCMSFTGTASYINCGSSSSFNFTTNQFSIAFWCKPSINTFSTLYSKGNYLAGYYTVVNSNSTVGFYLNNSGQSNVTTVSNLTTTAWSHITAIYNGNSTSSIYFNGKLETTGYTRSPNSVSTSFVIGGYPDAASMTAGYYYNGYLEDLRIYDRALTQQEVQSIYNSGRGTYDNSFKQGFPTVKPPIHHWKLQEFTGNLANDSGSNPYVLSCTGCTYAQSGISRDNYSIMFQGTSTSIISREIPSDMVNKSAYSISLWAMLLSNSASGNLGIFEGGQAWGRGFTLYKTNSELIAYAQQTAATSTILYGTLPPDNNWHNHIIIKNNSVASLYIDGTLNISGTGITCDNSGTTLAIGGRIGAANAISKMQDVRIYDYALSADEVRNIYNLGKGTLLT